MKQLYTSLILLIGYFNAFSQAPNINYQTPQVYSLSTPITPLSPSNTGGAVPATVYGQVTTYAGNTSRGLVNGTGTSASFNSPTRLALDASGNAFVADRDNNTIRKIAPGGVVSTYSSGYYSQPNGVTVDVSGNVYVADASNNAIKKITPGGVVTTLAGSGSIGSNNGTGTGASFYFPFGVTADQAGNVYVADARNNLIRKVTAAGVVSTLAGNGFKSFADGIAASASFNDPNCVALDGNGNVYVSDPVNNRIRKITSAGIVSTYAGTGTAGLSNAMALSATFNNPCGVCVDAINNVYVADLSNNCIRKIDAAGLVTTLAGSTTAGALDGIGTLATLNRPNDVQIDKNGYLFVTDFGNSLIRKICITGYTIDKALPAGLVFDATTGIISGTPTVKSPSTNYTITAYNVSGSSSTVVNITVNGITLLPPNISYQTPQVYTVNSTISPLAPVNTGGAVTGTGYGQVTTIAGNGPNGTKSGNVNGIGLAASFNNPLSTVADAGGNVYVADFGNNLIRKITPSGVVSTFAGNGTGHADGTGTAASFSGPYGMTIDAADNIFVTDFYNSTIRKISPAGVVTTVAGVAGSPGYFDDRVATAKFTSPWGISTDGSGGVYITDQAYHTVRRITGLVAVTTSAGQQLVAGSADGPGTVARFYYPKGLANDATGNVYVADSYNHLIRKVTNIGTVTTIAGTGTAGYIDGLSKNAKFNNPTGLAIDATGNIYVNDESNNAIRMISTSGVVTTVAGSGNAVSADGLGTGASFFHPSSISIDAQRNLYVTENNVIRKISTFGYAIDKALPAGLSFDPATGIISGTPAAASPATNYTITAYNAGGSSSALVNITILDIPGQTITFNPITPVVYGSPDFNLTANSTNASIPITYTSSNPAVATVTLNGVVHVAAVGQTIITASQAGNTAFKAATPVTQILTVTPAPLIITADSKTRTYSSVNPAFTFVYNGFVNGENFAVLTTQPAGATTATLTSAVGNYPITIAGAAASNYSITYVNGTLAVTQAQLTITADNQTRTYGTANPVLTLTYTGFLNGDDVTSLANQPVVTTTAVITSPVGQYPITVSGAAGANYLISFVNGVLNVTPKPITFNAIAVKTICDNDFDASATGGNAAITYTSSNTSVANIIAGKVHITGQGGTIITATDGFTSAQQTLTVITPTVPSVTIAADATSSCVGLPITFKATLSAPVITASYQWLVNGTNMGVNSDTFVSTTISKTDIIECRVTLTTPCPVVASSNQITGINVDNYVTPAITIQADQPMPVCSGTTVTFTASPTNEGTSPTYQWKVNGVNAGTNSKTFTSTAFADGDVVTCTLISSGGKCFAGVTATSAPSTISIIKAPLATVTITPSAIQVYSGSLVTFTANISPALTISGYQWLVNGADVHINNAVFTSNTLKNGDVVTCTVMVVAGCAFNITSGQLQMTILPSPIVKIPNTFTPNGDGVNDTWELKNLELYRNCLVRIFNRSGQLLFTSNGYPTAWDGRYKNSLLPVGVYYYIIDLKSNNQTPLSGSVTLIR